MKVPAEFEEVFQGVELTDKEVRFLGWIIGWDNWTIQNMRTVLQKVRAAGDGGTLPQPSNEPPPCYQPDGDGCAYQCYDGDDEPIDKCKECPLCYSDKQRHHTPPNEPRMINADKLAKRIAGHSNYHGDSILAAIYCAAEGKESDIPIQPIETQPNEPLTCEGCYYDKIKAYVHCSSCSRDKKDLYRRPPEGEEDANA